MHRFPEKVALLDRQLVLKYLQSNALVMELVDVLAEENRVLLRPAGTYWDAAERTDSPEAKTRFREFPDANFSKRDQVIWSAFQRRLPGRDDFPGREFVGLLAHSPFPDNLVVLDEATYDPDLLSLLTQFAQECDRVLPRIVTMHELLPGRSPKRKRSAGKTPDFSTRLGSRPLSHDDQAALERRMRLPAPSAGETVEALVRERPPMSAAQYVAHLQGA